MFMYPIKASKSLLKASNSENERNLHDNEEMQRAARKAKVINDFPVATFDGELNYLSSLYLLP